VEEMIKQASVRINRRTFLGRALAAVFGVFAGLSVGVPAVQAGPCSGPHGSGYCGSGPCAGSRCGSTNKINCRYLYGYCDADACWRSGAHRCCDCRCATITGYVFDCYCHG
jgi:hypothetical protein